MSITLPLSAATDGGVVPMAPSGRTTSVITAARTTVWIGADVSIAMRPSHRAESCVQRTPMDRQILLTAPAVGPETYAERNTPGQEEERRWDMLPHHVALSLSRRPRSSGRGPAVTA